MPRKKYGPEIKAQALVLYSTGMSYSAIARLLKISNHQTIRYWIDPKAAQQQAEYYQQNRDRLAEYRKENRDRIAQQKAEHYQQNRDRIAEYHVQYRKQNRDRMAQRDAKYRKQNPEKIRADKAKRRASKRDATPPWYTKEHQRQVEALQAEAVRLQRETGIQHHVDHIYPLTGKTRFNGKYQHTSCGLHAPWNLKVLPGPENCRKTYKLPDPATDPPTAW